MKNRRSKISYRRRLEDRTDYRNRLSLLRSGKPRLVVRKSLKNLVAQLVNYAPQGDMVVANAFSKELGNFDWKHSTGNIPAAYLTGYLCGTRALSQGKKEAVLDIGLNAPIRGSKIYAVLKGSIDAGLNVSAGEGIFPPEERITGKHIEAHKNQAGMSDDFKKVKENIQKSKGASKKKSLEAKKK